MEIFSVINSFQMMALKEFIRFLDSNREPIVQNVISMEGQKNGIPVEVAMIYNTSFNENLHSYVNNINTHEGGTHLSGFRRGLTGYTKEICRCLWSS